MRKTYILDTSCMCHDSSCFEKFEENDIVIPVAVLEELDHLKTRPDQVGMNARKSIKKIDAYCDLGSIQNGNGIDIGNGIRLFIDVEHVKDEKFSAGNKDDSILACFMYHSKQAQPAVLVSKDVNMRLRAKAFGCTAEDYNNDRLKDITELYSGQRDFNFDVDDYNGYVFSGENKIDVAGTPFESLHYNECSQITSNGKNTIYRRINDTLCKIVNPPDVFGIKSRNREQAYAIDLLLDPNVPLVTINGLTGSGKSLISVGCALELVIEQKKYNKVEVYKPIQEVGNGIGFLPGTVDEKLFPFMASFYDSLEVILGPKYKEKLANYEDKIKIEAMPYIRGRSISESIMLIDEVQNLNKNDIKTILTRIGHNSKIVLLGDTEQIDNSYLDSMNNGLSIVIETFKNSKLAGHITFTKGERSELSAEAAKLLR